MRVLPPVTTSADDDYPSDTVPDFLHLYATLETAIERAGSPEDLPDAEHLRRGYVLGITSAICGEGKTTVALHLAATAALNGTKRVALLDLGLDGGGLCRRLGLAAPQKGLNDLLEGPGETLETASAEQWHDLVVILGGKAPRNPARAARSARLPDVIDKLRRRFDIIFADLPAVVTDNAVPIARHLDGLVMVTAAGVTPSEMINHALDHLGREKVLGIVLNRTRSSTPLWIRKRLGVA